MIRLRAAWSGIRILVGTREEIVRAGSGAYPAFCAVGTGIVNLTVYGQLVPSLRMSGAVPLFICVCMLEVDGENLTFTFTLASLCILEHWTVKICHVA